MGPNWIRFGDRYCIPQDLIKYFRIETDNNKLIAKLKDGEEISLTYNGEDAYSNCLRNYVYLLDIFGIQYPNWLDDKELRKIRPKSYLEDDD